MKCIMIYLVIELPSGSPADPESQDFLATCRNWQS